MKSVADLIALYKIFPLRTNESYEFWMNRAFVAGLIREEEIAIGVSIAECEIIKV